jgi:hypothetical protein
VSLGLPSKMDWATKHTIVAITEQKELDNFNFLLLP